MGAQSCSNSIDLKITIAAPAGLPDEIIIDAGRQAFVPTPLPLLACGRMRERPPQLHSSVLYAASHIAFPASEHFLCEHQLRECVSAFLENVHERSMNNFEHADKSLNF